MKITALHPLFDEATIMQRIGELADEINACYTGKPLVVVGVLKGSFMFFSDLVRRLTCRPELDFIGLSSYGYSTRPDQRISRTKELTFPVEGKHVLIVEDIVDTGHSMQHLLDFLAAKGVLSVRLAALIDKHERREVPVTVDFPGFRVNAGFLVGYGLDYAEQCREFPAVYIAEIGPDDAPDCGTPDLV